MIRNLYNWTMGLAAHKHSERYLSIISFIESSFFPIPPDVMLIPMVLADRAKAWRYAFICTLASIIGGAAGYAIGLFLFDAIAQPLLDFYGYMEKFAAIQEGFNQYGAAAVFTFGITPFPYKVITIASGVTKLNFAIFMAASAASRGIRFFLVAGLLWKFGEPIRDFIEKRLELVTLVGAILLIGGFVAIKFVI